MASLEAEKAAVAGALESEVENDIKNKRLQGAQARSHGAFQARARIQPLS